MVEKNDIIIGACSAECISLDGASLFVPFVSKDLEKRTNPAASLKNVQSIIVVGVGYSESTQNPPRLSRQNREKHGFSAQLSSLGTCEDYHPRVKTILRDLAQEMGLEKGSYKILVDSPALDERALAYRAGLGVYGRNGLLISKKFGSRFNIGLLLTTLPFLLDERSRTDFACLGCNACIKACPVNGEKSHCVSYLTQKENLSPEEESIIKKSRQIYGCDICQDVCPLNKQKKATFINPQKWLDMSDDKLKKEYANTAMLWRGVDILRRNALLHI